MNALALQRDGGEWRLYLSGDWSLASMAHIERELESLEGPISGTLICDWSQAKNPGIGPVWALLRRLTELGSAHLEIRHEGAPHLVALLEKLEPGVRGPAARRRSRRRARTDRSARSGAGRCCRAGKRAEFSASSAVSRRSSAKPFRVRGRCESRRLHGIFMRPASRPFRSSRSSHSSSASSSPISGAQQLTKFGADIFVVDLVTIAVLREMGVLLTAIIVAGRSGSAFAAEIGVMQLNEETDALRAMGMNPIELLVVPRVLALVIALPLLTVIADAMGLAGGGLLSLVQLHIPLAQFSVRMRDALAPTTFWAGLVKAPVFALLIGIVGTYRGTQVRESARELGRLTTVAVVQSIFLIILADALFAILFVQIDF